MTCVSWKLPEGLACQYWLRAFSERHSHTDDVNCSSNQKTLAGQIQKSRPQVASVLLRVGKTIFQSETLNFSVEFAEAVHNRASWRCGELFAVAEATPQLPSLPTMSQPIISRGTPAVVVAIQPRD